MPETRVDVMPPETKLQVPIDDDDEDNLAHVDAQQEIHERRRSKEMTDICLQNPVFEDLDGFSCFKIGLKGFWGILIGLLSISGVTLWPGSNPINQPEFWYECAKNWIGFTFATALCILISFSSWINIPSIITAGNFLFLWVVALLIKGFTYFFEYIFWLDVGHLTWPMPFAGYIPSYAASLAAIYSCWFLFPKQWRKDKKFAVRLRWTSVAVILSFFIFATAYVGLALLFLAIPTNYQWVMALILPVVREIFSYAVEFAAIKACGTHSFSVALSAQHSVTSKNALFLAVAVGSTSTPLTTYLIIAIDFMINIILCCKVIYSKNKHGDAVQARGDLATLVMAETVEFMIPLGYLMCFLAAYYGFNPENLGNIGSSIWHYQATTDVFRVIKNVLAFFFIDGCSLIVTGALLRIFCKINVLQVYVHQMKEYGLVFAAQQMFHLNTEFCTLFIGCVSDFTLQFNWMYETLIENDMGMPGWIQNATNLVNATITNATLAL